MGMNISLFEWLDSSEASVELVHQYRMNQEIMNLANHITYNGKLQCLSSLTANSFIDINPEFLSSIKQEKLKKIFTKSVVFIDTSNLIKSTNMDNSCEERDKKIINKTESEIIEILVQIYFKVNSNLLIFIIVEKY